MKKKLSYFWIIICMAILPSCEKEDQIIPVYEESQSAETKSDQPNSLTAEVTGRKKRNNCNSLTSSITGNIDGRNFTGNLTIIEFIENAGELYAQGNLTDVKIKGKDHKYLEYILEKGTYTVPVSIDDMAQSEATNVVIAQATCPILNLTFGAINVDVLGLAVQIDLITITINANDDEVLGNLICTVLDTLNNVVDLVGLVNEILDLLTP